MQVFGLPEQIIRNGQVASRLLAAKTPDIEAARRRDAVARWRRAMADGLTAEQAAKPSASRARRSIAGKSAPSPARAGPHAPRQPTMAAGPCRARSRSCAPTIRCGANARSRRCSAAKAARPRSPPSDASSNGSWTKRASSSPSRSLRRRPGGRRFRFTPASATPSVCPRAARRKRARRTRPDRYALRQHPPRQADQALHRLRSGRQMDLRPCRQICQSRGRKGSARQAHRRGAIPNPRNPSRRRQRVSRRVRESLRR